VLGVQLDLFGDRHLQLEDARRALIEARAEDAGRELVRLRGSYPEDPEIAAELELAQTLERRLGEIDAASPAVRPRLLVALARAIAHGASASLLRRAAFELGCDGPTTLVDGKPASVLLLEAGDPHAAREAAEAAVRHSPRARFVSYLADVEHRLDRQSSARERYREALARDPYDIDWDELADEEVSSLPDIARTEFELPDGVAWAAPVGVAVGVLPVGDPPPCPAPRDRDAEPSAESALSQARCFLGALVRATRDRGAIDARRKMRALAPQLLAAFLAHR
jgi:tetratricopeptide (TPR) repeat protein